MNKFPLVLIILFVFFTGLTHASNSIEVGYDDGLFFNAPDKAYSLKLKFLLQPLHAYTDNEGATNTNSFNMARGEMHFFGNVFSSSLGYKVMFDMPGRTGGPTLNLRDSFLNWKFCDGLQLMGGSFCTHLITKIGNPPGHSNL